MKLVKMSLAAAVLLGASAFAIDNVKVSGDAKLYYLTHDAGTDDMFNKNASAADTALRIGVTGDLMKGVSFGLTGYAVSTLGLENNLVSNTWTGAHGAAANGSAFGAQVNDASWVSEAWVAGTAGKTTAKLGRMELDTPLAFSEKWSVAANTFEGAVLINQDIPDTTLVGAWVGKGNGTNALHNYAGPVGIDGIVAGKGAFNTYMNDGAYAAAIINNSFKPLVAQAWYYGVREVADAYWLQADLSVEAVKGLSAGVQLSELSPTGLLAGAPDSQAWAGKVAYSADALSVSAAYSEADKDGVLKVANTATNNLAAAQSKLYTEAYWNYGFVGAAGAKSVNVTASFDAGVAKVGAFYTNVTSATVNPDMQEIAVEAAKSFGPLDATVAYVNTDVDGADASNMIIAMLKLNF